MAKRKSTTVSGYYRKGHHTASHRRALSDSPYMLELAEGGLSARNLVSRHLSLRTLTSRLDVAPLYLVVPDPLGEVAPIFVREDMLYYLQPAELAALLNWVKPLNTKSNMAAIRARVTAFQNSALADEDTDYVETAGEVVSIIDTVLGWFEGSSSGGGSAPNGAIINAQGFVVGLKYIASQNHDIIFGYSPNKTMLIAFSTPANMRAFFPNLGNVGGTSNPFPLLPGDMPAGLIDYSLSHPDTMVRVKQGGGYEVAPAGYVSGYDGNGNPIVHPPSPPPGTGGSGASTGGVSSILPLGIGLGLLSMFKS